MFCLYLFEVTITIDSNYQRYIIVYNNYNNRNIYLNLNITQPIIKYTLYMYIHVHTCVIIVAGYIYTNVNCFICVEMALISFMFICRKEKQTYLSYINRNAIIANIFRPDNILLTGV